MRASPHKDDGVAILAIDEQEVAADVTFAVIAPTTLAPDIVAAILDDALPNHITLFELAVDPPALWDEQRERVGL